MKIVALERALLQFVGRARGQADYGPEVVNALASLMEVPATGETWLSTQCARGAVVPGAQGQWRVDAECMVDIVFMHRGGPDDPWMNLLTAESEAWAQHAVDLTDDCDEDGYFWDLYKLLHFGPSPIRVFAAVTRPARGERLRENLERYAMRYAHCFRTDEVLYIVTIRDADVNGWMAVSELRPGRPTVRRPWVGE